MNPTSFLKANAVSTASTTSNPLASVHNKLSFDVTIYDVYITAKTDKDIPTYVTYQELGTVKAGETIPIQTIRAASHLQAMRTGPIEAFGNAYYKQFPVAAFPSVTEASSALEITTNQQLGMEEAFRFIKYSTANADSQTTAAFSKAMMTVPVENQETVVNQLFAATSVFSHCTLDSWTAVVAWQAQFTNAWQNTYYLYSNVEGTVTATNTPKLLATVVITAKAETDEATLTLEGSGGQSVSLQMVGDGSMQEANPGEGDISAQLVPLWLNVTQANTVDGETVYKNVISGAMQGTLNGTKVTGVIYKYVIPTPDSGNSGNSGENTLPADAGSNTFISSDAFIGIVTISSTIATIVATILGWKGLELSKKQFARELAQGNAVEELQAHIKALEDFKLLLEKKLNEVEFTELTGLYRRVAASIHDTDTVIQLDRLDAQFQEALARQAPSEEIQQIASELKNLHDTAARHTAIDPVIYKNIGDRITKALEKSSSLTKQMSKSLEAAKATVKDLASSSKAVNKAKEEREKAKEKAPIDLDDDDFVEIELNPRGNLPL